MFKILGWFLISFSFVAYSNEDVLSIDRVVPHNIDLAFPNKLNIQPEQSDFEVNNFILMSNEVGQRWAVVTVTNLASGGRSLTNKHLMALIANGGRREPVEFSRLFKANETLSVTINFGESQFPLLSVYSRTD